MALRIYSDLDIGQAKITLGNIALNSEGLTTTSSLKLSTANTTFDMTANQITLTGNLQLSSHITFDSSCQIEWSNIMHITNDSTTIDNQAIFNKLTTMNEELKCNTTLQVQQKIILGGVSGAELSYSTSEQSVRFDKPLNCVFVGKIRCGTSNTSDYRFNVVKTMPAVPTTNTIYFIYGD